MAKVEWLLAPWQRAGKAQGCRDRVAAQGRGHRALGRGVGAGPILPSPAWLQRAPCFLLLPSWPSSLQRSRGRAELHAAPLWLLSALGPLCPEAWPCSPLGHFLALSRPRGVQIQQGMGETALSCERPLPVQGHSLHADRPHRLPPYGPACRVPAPACRCRLLW